MKKILFAVLIFIVNISVFALEKEKIMYEYTPDWICDKDENIYSIDNMRYNSYRLYRLNPALDHNYNYEQYYPISWEESPFSKEIYNYSGIDIWDNDYFGLAIHLLMWNALYPEKEFHLCSDPQDSEKITQNIYSMIDNVNQGPLDQKTIVLNEGEEYRYQNPYYSYFELVDDGQVDIKLLDNTVILQGKKGKYQIVYQRKNAGRNDGPSLYTDGTNYIVVDTQINSERYIYDVIIGYSEVKINVTDDKQNKLSDVCFDIDKKEYCTDKHGSITIFLENDNYHLSGCNNGFEDYEEKIEVSGNKEMNIVLKPETSVEEEIDNITQIDLPNTFMLSSSLLITLIGAFFVWQKK